MKHYLIYIVCSIMLISCQTTSIVAQDYITTKEISPKVKKAYTKAYQQYRANDIPAAKKSFEKIIKKNPTFINAYHLMAECYIREKDWLKAVEYYKKSTEIAPDYQPNVYYKLAQIAMEQEQYVEARKQLEKFLTYPKTSESMDQMARKMLGDAKFRPEALSKPVDFQPKNMGENINSAQRDYFPSITADENTLIYTVQLGEGRTAQEDLYRSIRKDGEWQKAEPLPNVNTPENEAAQSISADGKFLVFTVCNRPNDFGSCDLYFSERVNGRWTTPQNLGPAINTNQWESQPSVAPNGDAIYFTRGGARGQGDKDLWVSYRREDGKWGKPVELETLNTPFDEGAPCIHPDGQTLYFSSSGHPGMGELDLFVSRKDERGIWGKPQNLGYPINTAEAEEALAVSLTGDLAFIASNRQGGFGSLDIYSFVMPEEVRPNAVTYVRALVFDAETKKELANTKVELVDLGTGKSYAKLQTDKDGEFLVCLPMGKDYALNVNRKQYLFYSDNFALKEERKLKDPFQLKIPLQPIKKEQKDPNKKENQPIILKNVFFATNSAELRPASKTELDKLKALLDENPAMRIRLQGHTDNVGEEADNMDLSDRRANAVKDYLIKAGIKAERLEAKGFGETTPIASNDTPKGRQQNRRTEFLVLD
jgi:outer membrane protein OmpA-like peptidoglycan-associated protein/Tfp pilus assembly protein PilF